MGPRMPGELVALVDALRVPCVGLLPVGGRVGAADSYAGGHPFWPDGADWPEYAGRPMSFVAQIDAAALPIPVPGFPERGLLQWFVGADDVLGAYGTPGEPGFHTRWTDPSAAPSVRAPSDPTPAHIAERRGDDIRFALETRMPIPLRPFAVQTIPYLDEAGIADTEPIARWAEQLDEDPDDLDYVWAEHVRGPSSPLADIWRGSNIGGFPTFTQWDVRGTDDYAPWGAREGALILELDSDDIPGWGDGGVGHLFGIASDTATHRYQWDCL
ncbi:DUF1963 domain-containing protein [Tsukamurella soli]|uniref:DUF1963 domain-containing protein n=2 Tax=Tsukamurella soli TaxID=644556 RepID=A0ABP8K7I4_9ACTN